MVSSPHEAMHRIFQQHPGVFVRAARAIGDDPVSSSPLPTDLTENHPLERRVDTLVRVDTADSGSFIFAVEAQRKKDLHKRDESAADIFIELTAQGLGTGTVAEYWRKLVTMDLSFFQSPPAQELRDEGRDEGRAQGEAEALLLVLAGRGIDVSDEARERISNCTDHATLSTWLTRAATATSAAEIFEDE